MLRFFNNTQEDKYQDRFLLTVKLAAAVVPKTYLVDKYTFENFNSWINSRGYFVEIFDLKDNRRYGLRKDSILNYNIEIIKEVKNDK